jgi:UDP-N-acetylglucosamine enolpyruvyl transferase
LKADQAGSLLLFSSHFASGLPCSQVQGCSTWQVEVILVSLVSQDGNTAIMYAAESKCEDIVKALIEAGADVNGMASVRF